MKIRDGGESISAETYRALREHILSGRIAPGIEVTTPELCNTFGTSPGAVRSVQTARRRPHQRRGTSQPQSHIDFERRFARFDPGAR